MKNPLNLLLILILGLTSCKSDKKYSDYNEDDFYEIQGIINSANRTSDPFDNPTIKNVSYTYFLDRPNPKIGTEINLDMFEAQKGYPVIVLVHIDDENVSFYGRVGILGTLNKKEEDVLQQHLESVMEN